MTDDPTILRAQLMATTEAFSQAQRQIVQLTHQLQDSENSYMRQERLMLARAAAPPPPPPPADPEVAALLAENGELRRRVEGMRIEFEQFKAACTAEVAAIRARSGATR